MAPWRDDLGLSSHSDENSEIITAPDEDRPKGRSWRNTT